MATKKSTGTRTAAPRKTAAKTAAKTSAASTKASPNFHHPGEIQERIRQRAYELFQKRGGQHGFDVEDWLRAEGEISGTGE